MELRRHCTYSQVERHVAARNIALLFAAAMTSLTGTGSWAFSEAFVKRLVWAKAWTGVKWKTAALQRYKDDVGLQVPIGRKPTL